MKSFKLTVTSPDGNAFSGDVQMLTVRGVMGALAVMAGHTPLVTALKPCTIKIVTENNEILADIGGGILSVSKEQTLLLSSSYSVK